MESEIRISEARRSLGLPSGGRAAIGEQTSGESPVASPTPYRRGDARGLYRVPSIRWSPCRSGFTAVGRQDPAASSARPGGNGAFFARREPGSRIVAPPGLGDPSPGFASPEPAGIPGILELQSTLGTKTGRQCPGVRHDSELGVRKREGRICIRRKGNPRFWRFAADFAPTAPGAPLSVTKG